jgi:hypothetical protein
MKEVPVYNFLFVFLLSPIPLPDFNPGTKVFTHEQFQMTAGEGDFLIWENPVDETTKIRTGEVNIFTNDGIMKTDFTLPPGFEIATMTWLPVQRVYPVVARHRKEKTQRIFLFDEWGELFGHGYDLSKSENQKDAYFRQIIPVGNRIFVNIWNSSYQAQLKPKMLQEVDLRIHDDGYGFAPLGEPFDQLTGRSRQFMGQFKLRWIVPDYKTQGFYVLDQLQEKVRPFTPIRGAKRGLFHREYEKTIVLNGFVDRTNHFPDEGITKWWHSFSRMTGFYESDPGEFLVSYLIPNPLHREACNEKEDGVLSADKPAPFSLALQRLDANLKIEGSVTRDSRFLLCVHEGVAYLFNAVKQDGIFQVETIQLSDI